MIRYCRQRCKTRCGPVALLNLAKWQGKGVTYRDIEYFERICGWSQQAGTPLQNMVWVLHKRPRRLSFSEFKQHLQNGGAVLLWIVEPNQPETHYCLAIGIEKGKYLLVNYCQKHTLCRQSYRHMAYLLRHGKGWTFK